MQNLRLMNGGPLWFAKDVKLKTSNNDFAVKSTSWRTFYVHAIKREHVQTLRKRGDLRLWLMCHSWYASSANHITGISIVDGKVVPDRVALNYIVAKKHKLANPGSDVLVVDGRVFLRQPGSVLKPGKAKGQSIVKDGHLSTRVRYLGFTFPRGENGEVEAWFNSLREDEQKQIRMMADGVERDLPVMADFIEDLGYPFGDDLGLMRRSVIR